MTRFYCCHRRVGSILIHLRRLLLKSYFFFFPLGSFRSSVNQRIIVCWPFFLGEGGLRAFPETAAGCFFLFVFGGVGCWSWRGRGERETERKGAPDVASVHNSGGSKQLSLGPPFSLKLSIDCERSISFIFAGALWPYTAIYVRTVYTI